MKSRINGWIIGSRYYIPFLILGLSLLILGLRNVNYFQMCLGVIFLIIFGFVLAFFRDFPRKVTAKDDEFVSPADGKIVEIYRIDGSDLYKGECIKIAIFMSLFNVHINRSPFGGIVKKVQHKSGKFMNAMRSEAGEYNESNSIWIETEKGTIVVRQVAGLVARRIICNLSEGDYVRVGEKFGMIKFGSRVELFLPINVELYVKLGDKVYAGKSVLGRFL